jgi:hypothetical protein
MIALVVSWILKVTRYTGSILLDFGLILMVNLVHGVLIYPIMGFGELDHQKNFQKINHC